MNRSVRTPPTARHASASIAHAPPHRPKTSGAGSGESAGDSQERSYPLPALSTSLPVELMRTCPPPSPSMTRVQRLPSRATRNSASEGVEGRQVPVRRMSAVVAPTASPRGARSASRNPSRTVASLLSRTTADSLRPAAPAMTPAPKPSFVPAFTRDTRAGLAAPRSSPRPSRRTVRESSSDPLSTMTRWSPSPICGAIEWAARRVSGAFFQLTRITLALRALIAHPPGLRRRRRARRRRPPTCSRGRARYRRRRAGRARSPRPLRGPRRGPRRRWPTRGFPHLLA